MKALSDTMLTMVGKLADDECLSTYEALVRLVSCIPELCDNIMRWRDEVPDRQTDVGVGLGAVLDAVYSRYGIEQTLEALTNIHEGHETVRHAGDPAVLARVHDECLALRTTIDFITNGPN